jgi:hypothetical protein
MACLNRVMVRCHLGTIVAERHRHGHLARAAPDAQPPFAGPNPRATVLPQTIMSKVKVLFFAADPLSVDGHRARLQLDREAREIEREVVAALHRDDVQFETRWATRLGDLRRELLRVQPDVVHFSGHGGSNGLVLEAEDRKGSHRVDAPALKEFFSAFRGKIRVVVLNACHSRPQAEAIADAVGCAIGTPDRIQDEAAISFSAAFYSSIAYGQSVQAAFDQACATLNMGGFAGHEDPQLVMRPGLKASDIVLVQPPGENPVPPDRRIARAAGVAAVLSCAAVATYLISQPDPCAPAREAQRAVMKAGTSPQARIGLMDAPDPNDPRAGPRELVEAKQQHAAGNHIAEFSALRQAAQDGAPEAMTSLGLAFMRGEGTAVQPDSGIEWLRKAANRGDARGMNELAEAYQRGDGVERNLNYWMKHWYEQAAEKGYAEAMYNLGNLYRDGRGVPADSARARDLYIKAANAGFADAMVSAGDMYEQSRNEKVAMCWYNAAAEAGSKRGKAAIGIVDDSLTKADDVDE